MTAHLIWHDTRKPKYREPYEWQADGDRRREYLHSNMFRVGQLWSRIAEGKRRDG